MINEGRSEEKTAIARNMLTKGYDNPAPQFLCRCVWSRTGSLLSGQNCATTDKVRLNCYYYHHYSFITDIQMIFATVLGKKMMYAGELI